MPDIKMRGQALLPPDYDKPLFMGSTYTVDDEQLTELTEAGVVEPNYVIALAANPATGVVADGVATSTLTATVTNNGQPVAGLTVLFWRSSQTAVLSAESAVTNASGVASVTLANTLPTNGAGETVTVVATAARKFKSTTVDFTAPVSAPVPAAAPPAPEPAPAPETTE